MKKLNLILIALLLLTQLCKAQNNPSADSTFGEFGRLKYEVGMTTSGQSGMGTRSLKMLDNGDLLIATTSKIDQFTANRNYWVSKLKSDGTVDLTFGDNGKTIIFSGNDAVGNALIAVDISLENKILLCGERKDPFTFIEETYLIQLNSNGIIDSSFGTDGRVILSVSPINSFTRARDAKFLSDGEIIILTTIRETATNPVGLGHEFCFIKLNENGSIADSFGNNGVKIVSDPTVSDAASFLKLLPNGKIVAVGTSGSPINIKLICIDSSGEFDQTFGNNGIVLYPTEATTNVNLYDYEITDNNQHVFCGVKTSGGSSTLSFVVRLNSNGTADSNFGNNGIFQTGSTDALMKSLELGNGKRLLLGRDLQTVVLMRLNEDGTQDMSFGVNGKGSLGNTNPAGTNDMKCILFSDGKLLIGGYYMTNQTDHYSLLKVKFGSSSTTGVNSPQTNSLILYPNPSRGMLYFDYSEQIKNIEIYDLNGKTVFISSNPVSNKIELHSLKSGMHLVSITDVHGKKHRQIVMLNND